MRQIDRRGFIALSFGAVAWACARPGRDRASPDADDAKVSLAVASVEHAIGDRRLAVAYVKDGVPAVPADLEASLLPPKADAIDVDARIVRIGFRAGGDTSKEIDVKRLVVCDHPFEDPGIWQVRLTTADGRFSAPFNVVEGSKSPAVGESAIESKSATTDDPRGVKPICTRVPACTQHEMTVADAVTSGKPSVISFVTPALCVSRTCGPSLDVIEEAKEKSGDGINFVHVEIYADRTGKQQSKPVQEWQLPGEPWIVFVGDDGKVKARWSGAVGREEFPDALDALRRGTL